MLKNIINNIIDELLEEWNDDTFKKKINEQLLDPILFYLVDRLYPYFIITSVAIIVLLLLLIMILYLLITKK